MKKQKKKYSYGTGKNGVVRHYIESPDETITESQIMLAKAREKAMGNAWGQGLDIFGNMAVQYGTNMMTSGVGAGGQAAFGGKIQPGGGDGGAFGQKFGDWMGNNSQMLASGISMLPMLAHMMGPGFAFGGRVPSKVPVEVEGKEVGETPDGQLVEFKGPSHENGGIDINLPEGTEIFSKRIKVKGKTMAERKKAREKKALTLEKLLEKNGNDKVLKDSLARTKKNNKKEEMEDQKLQNMIGTMKQMVQEFAYGGKVKYDNGGKVGPGGIKYGDPDPNNPADPYHYMTDEEFLAKSQNFLALNGGGNNPQIDYDAINNYFNKGTISDNASLDGIGMTDQETSFDSYVERLNRPYQGETNSSKETSEDPVLPGEKMKLPNFTSGDLIGMAGTLYSAFKPMQNTEKNRAGDTPNINAFEDYGNDALDAIDNAKGYVAGQRDKALKDLETSRTRITKNNRNSARGINTIRALDLATDVNANKAQSDIYDNFSKQMMQLLSQQAGFENQQDQAVMAGEQARDLADRQDRDNYYTQLAQDIATKGEGIQTIGKMLNQNKKNTMAEKAVNDSSINFKYSNGTLTDKAGNLVMTQVELKKAADTLGITVEEYINLINKKQNG